MKAASIHAIARDPSGRSAPDAISLAGSIPLVSARGPWIGYENPDAFAVMALHARRPPVSWLLAAAAAALLSVLAATPGAHEIPNDVTVQSFIKPEGQRLHLLVRVPLVAMRDLDYPTRGPGYLDLTRIEPSLRDAAMLWVGEDVKIYEDDTLLGAPTIVAVRVSLPSDRSFASYEQALGHFSDPLLSNDLDLYWQQGLLDVLFEYPIRSDQAQFSIDPGLERLGLRVINVIRFLPPGGAVRAFEFPGAPGLVRLDPRWHQAAWRFVELGFFHILDGTDHLLFLLCLIIPFRRLRALVWIVTSFTVAHSITLMSSAAGLAPSALWFPPLIETLIAASILYMALENIVGPGLERRWLITFGFGLVHGFGFSFALGQTLQFAGSHLLTSLLSFNVGVELGQLAVLIVLVPALDLLFQRVVAERLGTIILSALVAHIGWHWLVERGARLGQFDWPTIDAAFLASAMRWGMLFVALAGAYWLIAGWVERGRTGAPGAWSLARPAAKSQPPAAND